MTKYCVTVTELSAFEQYLQSEEREAGTIEKYRRDIQLFAVWARGGR